MNYISDKRIMEKGSREMARYTTKYKIGQRVESQGIPGQITAITFRKGHRAYEFSYIKDGGPTPACARKLKLPLAMIIR